MNNELEANRQQALQRAKRLATSIPGVKGVDLGYIYKNGVKTRKRGIRFHVERKVALAALEERQALPKDILGVPCDVIQAKYAPHALSPRSLFDPIRPGISTGNPLRNSTGTIGLLVYDEQTNATFILSNWHVLCGSTAAEPGEPITQPGPRHLGSMPPRNVAELSKWTSLSNGYDAAIAQVVPGVSFDEGAFGSNLIALRIGKPKVGMQLVKSGVSSGVTHAVVDGIDGSFEMDYTNFGDQVRWMDGIHLVPEPSQASDEISLEGDSGAVWIEPQQKLAVALHFAGEDGLGPLAEYAVAHPLSRVLELLDVSLLPH